MTDLDYLKQAMELTKQSTEPVGCGTVIVLDGEIIGEAYNSQRTDNVAFNHAEMKALQQANAKRRSRTLQGSVAYCSCQPCPMCITALSYAKVGRIVYAQRFSEVFPDDTLADFDFEGFTQCLNFVPKLQHLVLS